ncbi:MAG TPA: glycosyltransferase [Thermomicrobiales bacterium]|nr:glycosyltransferase [Thermomicrobiales bacterium]
MRDGRRQTADGSIGFAIADRVGLRKPPLPTADCRLPTDVSLAVSVVVPTCRRPALLGRCLDALAAQDFDPDAYEILVVDDAACPETRRLVACRARREAPAIRYLTTACECAPGGEHRPRGPAVARNAGWRHARGEIAAFTDDDCVPDPGWLAAGLRAFACGGGDCRAVAGVRGRIVVPLRPAPTDYERDAAGLEHSEFATANCFYRRAALAGAGGFDERFTLAWREDSDLYFTLLERGARLVHAPDAVVVHPVRPAPWGVSLRQQRKSGFNALLYKKHPALYRQRVQAAPPWRYYASVAALAAALGSAAARRPAPATAGAAIWAALTGQFCARRLRDTSRAPRHVAEMVVTSALIPPLAVGARLAGAVRHRVLFL